MPPASREDSGPADIMEAERSNTYVIKTAAAMFGIYRCRVRNCPEAAVTD
jgi:hypothetical protein